MAKIKNIFLSVKPVERVIETMRVKEHLFGLIKIERLVKTDKIGEELRIIIDTVPEKIFINGVRYKPSK